jgi:hypothetical protein
VKQVLEHPEKLPLRTGHRTQLGAPRFQPPRRNPNNIGNEMGHAGLQDYVAAGCPAAHTF